MISLKNWKVGARKLSHREKMSINLKQRVWHPVPEVWSWFAGRIFAMLSPALALAVAISPAQSRDVKLLPYLLGTTPRSPKWLARHNREDRKKFRQATCRLAISMSILHIFLVDVTVVFHENKFWTKHAHILYLENPWNHFILPKPFGNCQPNCQQLPGSFGVLGLLSNLGRLTFILRNIVNSCPQSVEDSASYQPGEEATLPVKVTWQQRFLLWARQRKYFHLSILCWGLSLLIHYFDNFNCIFLSIPLSLQLHSKFPLFPATIPSSAGS